VSKIELGPLPKPAGDIYDERGPGRVWRCFCWNADQMRSYAEQEVARERERCAKVCDDIAEAHQRSGRYVSVVADHSVRAGGQVDGAEECARSIRKGSEA
jgi:hypothetical protein